MNEELIGNLTTVIKTVSMIIAGYLLATATANGLNLPIDQATLSQIIISIIFFGLAYLDAKYPNTFKFLGNSKAVLLYDNEEKVLNDEYVCEEE